MLNSLSLISSSDSLSFSKLGKLIDGVKLIIELFNLSEGIK